MKAVILVAGFHRGSGEIHKEYWMKEQITYARKHVWADKVETMGRVIEKMLTTKLQG